MALQVDPNCVWQCDYLNLLEFVQTHPEIDISGSSICIPSRVRDKFYQLFDSTRVNTLTALIKNELDLAQLLSNYFRANEDALRSRFDALEVVLPIGLSRFLHDPTNEMGSSIFDSLFDLLKGRTRFQEYLADSQLWATSMFNGYFAAGYEKLIILSLLELMDADALYSVRINESITSGEQIKARSNLPTIPLPNPQKNQQLKFDFKYIETHTIPNLIAHCRAKGVYVSVRSEVQRAYCRAHTYAEKKQWIPISELAVPVEKGATLVYIDNNLSDLQLVADVDRLCRPNLVIFCKTQSNWIEEEKEFHAIHDSHTFLAPENGTYIILGGMASNESAVDLGEGIRVLNVGFNAEKLMPVVHALNAI